MNPADIELCPKCGAPLRLLERTICDSCIRRFLGEPTAAIAPPIATLAATREFRVGDRVRMRKDPSVHESWWGHEGEVYMTAHVDGIGETVCAVLKGCPVTARARCWELLGSTRDALESALDELKDVAG